MRKSHKGNRGRKKKAEWENSLIHELILTISSLACAIQISALMWFHADGDLKLLNAKEAPREKKDSMSFILMLNQKEEEDLGAPVKVSIQVKKKI